MSPIRRKRVIRPVDKKERNYRKFFTVQNIGEALVDELANTPFQNNLKAFQESNLWKSYRSSDINFWRKIVEKNVRSRKNDEKNIKSATLEKYARDCYWAFSRKFEIINKHFQAKILGKLPTV